MKDLQQVVLRRLVDTTSSDLYSKLSSKYFTGNNLLIYGKIQNFYKAYLRVPNKIELESSFSDEIVKGYYQTQILDPETGLVDIADEFLLKQLQDHAIRDETIYFLSNFIPKLNDYETGEILDSMQNHLLELNKSIPMGEELLDVATLQTIPDKDTFVMYPSGLSEQYDSVNGGFALQELVLIGGRRGSGKSILALNAALNRYLGISSTPNNFQGPSTVGFFSIEMRYLEVYYRMMSILSRVPFLKFMKNELLPEEILHVAKTKLDIFYKPNDLLKDIYSDLVKTKDIKAFDKALKSKEIEQKDHRFFIIDDPKLSLNRLDHYCNLFANKYPNFTMAAVDYLNIIKVDDNKDWKSQITIADDLKLISRKYNVTVLSPYQVDATLEARFAKGILDSADRAFVFAPKQQDDPDANLITLFTAKVRNGKNITFDVGMDWECTRVDTAVTTKNINENSKLLKGTQYGSGTSENYKDVAIND